MRTSHHPSSTEHIRDPLGLATHASKSSNAADPETESQTHSELIVNPLWMITGALAVFVILFFAVS
jgi:hypothetical protein